MENNNRAGFSIYGPNGQRVRLTWLEAVGCRLGLLESLCDVPHGFRQGVVPFEIPEDRSDAIRLVDELSRGIDALQLQRTFSITLFAEVMAAAPKTAIPLQTS